MSNSRSFRRATAALAATAAGALVLVPMASAAPAPETATGPSTSTAPYIVPVAPGVTVTSLLTVGDTEKGVAGFPMVGIPDGLGAYAGPDGSFTALMTHELRSNVGAVRAHGQKGAFVSKWTIDARTGEVTAGSDLIQQVIDWDYASGTYDADTTADSAFARFCSSSLTEPGQLLHKGIGYEGQLFFGNEENGDSSRTFGITMDGVAYQLPRIGLFSSETTVVAPTRSSATVALGNEDNNPGEIRLYVGTKQATGSPVDKAGLTNGALHVLTVPGFATDAAFRANPKGTPVPATFSQIDWTKDGVAQNGESAAKGITLNRIEDGAFDPRKPNDYYFLTTDGGAGTGIGGGGGLWLLRFADVSDPLKGATLTLLLDGTEAPTLNKPDNMTIDNGGNVLIQEDPGGEDALARVVAYRIADGRTGVVAQFDPAQFTPGAAGFITRDEESSGIIDVSALVKKPNTFLLDAQVHAPAADPNLVEKGQLLTMTVQSWGQVYGD
jgi:hypothetical protein